MYRRNEVTGLEAFGAVILLILLVLVSRSQDFAAAG